MTLSSDLPQQNQKSLLIDLLAPIQREAALHIAIGNNTALQTEAQALGLAWLVSVIHPRASVSTFGHMGAVCFVAAGAFVAPAARLGIGVIVNHCAVIDHDTGIGDFSHVAQNASGAVVMSSVVLGNDVMLSSGSVASCDLLAPGVYSGPPAVKIE